MHRSLEKKNSAIWGLAFSNINNMRVVTKQYLALMIVLVTLNAWFGVGNASKIGHNDTLM